MLKKSKTYAISMGLISMDPEEIKTAMLMMGELVLKDLQQTPMQSPLVYYLECTRKFGEQQLDGLNSLVEQADGHSSPFEPKPW